MKERIMRYPYNVCGINFEFLARNIYKHDLIYWNLLGHELKSIGVIYIAVYDCNPQ